MGIFRWLLKQTIVKLQQGQSLSWYLNVHGLPHLPTVTHGNRITSLLQGSCMSDILYIFLIKCSDKCNLSTSFKIRNLSFIFKHPLSSVNHSFYWLI